MHLKWIGAIMVIAGCGGCGFSMATDYCRVEKQLRQLLNAMDLMYAELEYRMSPLAQVCTQVAEHTAGPVGRAFQRLADELDAQISPNAGCCMTAALSGMPELPDSVRSVLEQLGRSMGCFDLQGQLTALRTAKADCERALQVHLSHKDSQVRGCQTLALCAGAALAILLI